MIFQEAAEVLLRWLDALQAKAPGAAVQLVLSHADRLAPIAARVAQGADLGEMRAAETQNACSRLDQRRFLRPNTRFAAFFKLYKKIIFAQSNLQNLANFCKLSFRIL